MRLLAALFVLFAVGCTHTIDLRQYGAKTSAPNLKGKKVAVILDRVPNETDSASDVYRFQFRNMREGVKQAAEKFFVPVAKEVVVVSSDKMPKAFDLYVYPELSIRSTNDFWTIGCLVKFKSTVYDRNQKQIGSANKDFKRSVFFMSQFQDKCNDAMNEVFSEVVGQSL